MTRRRAISPAKLDRLGWCRSDQKPWRSKTHARYEHVDGWRLVHCGHPTALHPWALYDPRGRMVLAGAAHELRRPDFGTAWDTLDQATAYVAALDSYERENGPRWFALGGAA